MYSGQCDCGCGFVGSGVALLVCSICLCVTVYEAKHDRAQSRVCVFLIVACQQFLFRVYIVSQSLFTACIVRRRFANCLCVILIVLLNSLWESASFFKF